MASHIWKIAAGALALIIIYVVVSYMKLNSPGGPLETVLADQCLPVAVAPGAEDIHYDADTGLVFISADNRRVVGHDDQGGAQNLDGNGIYVLDVTPARLEDIGPAVNVTPSGLEGFRPHGIYLWSDGAGVKRLFVVNHRTDGKELVDIFDVGERGALTHVEGVSFPEMFHPNDVVATGPNSFYASNFLRNKAGFMLYAEIFLSLPVNSVVYFDGESGRTVADGLALANGVNLSPDTNTLYVAEWTKKQVRIFERRDDNSLKRKGKIKLRGAVDNLDVEDDGTIWAASQARLSALVDSVTDPSVISPSIAMKIDPETKTYETAFLSKDGEINSSSAAVIAGDKLLIGTVYDSHVLVCKKPG